MRTKTYVIGGLLGVATTFIVYVGLLGGSTFCCKLILGNGTYQRFLHLQDFYCMAVPGFILAVLGTLLRGLEIPPARLLMNAFCCVGILAILLPLLAIVFFENHTDVFLWGYLISTLILSSVFWTLRLEQKHCCQAKD